MTRKKNDCYKRVDVNMDKLWLNMDQDTRSNFIDEIGQKQDGPNNSMGKETVCEEILNKTIYNMRQTNWTQLLIMKLILYN